MEAAGGCCEMRGQRDDAGRTGDELLAPISRHGVESRLRYVNSLGALPDRPATEAEEPELAACIQATSHQHPDHDTEPWPPAE